MCQLLAILQPKRSSLGRCAASCFVALIVMFVTQQAAWAAIHLEVIKSASDSSVSAGQTVTYTYEVTNLETSDEAVDQVWLVDTFDRGNAVESIGDTPADWSCSLDVLSSVSETFIECEYAGSMANSGLAHVLELEVEPATVDDEVVLGNTAKVSARGVQSDSEADQESSRVEVLLKPSADMRIERAGVPTGAVDAEGAFSWTLKAVNEGPSAARDLVMEENLPAGAELVSISGSWDCLTSSVSGQIRCELPQLAASGESTVTLNARAPRNPADVGQVSAESGFGKAIIEADTHDPDDSNNTVDANEDALLVAARWNLSVSKTASVQETPPEQQFSYLIEIANDGPSDLSGDIRPRLNDEMDSRLKGVVQFCADASRPCWACMWEDSPALMDRVDAGSDQGDDLAGAWPLALDPDGVRLAAGGSSDRSLVVFDRETARGQDYGLLDRNSFADTTGSVRVLAFHPGGQWLVAANSGSGAGIEVFEYAGDGLVSSVQTYDGGFSSVSALVFSPDGRSLYLADGQGSGIGHFSFDENADVGNSERPLDESSGTFAQTAATDLAISADGRYLYAAVPGSHSIEVFEAGSSGQLSHDSSYPLASGGSSIAPVAIVAGQNSLYAGGDDAVVAFARNSASGVLASAEYFAADSAQNMLLRGIRALALDNSGGVLAVAASDDRSISLFRRAQDGSLEFVRSDVLPDEMQPNDLAMDGRGEHLYASATAGPADGIEPPALSALLTYSLAAAAGCDDLEYGESGAGDIEDMLLTLPAGQTVTVQVLAAARGETPTGTVIDNEAVLTAALGEGESQPEVLRSHAEVAVRNVTGVAVEIDEGLLDRPVPGETFSFGFTVANSGPTKVEGLDITTVLPTFSGGSNSLLDDTLEWQCTASGDACCNPGYGSAQCGRQETVYGSGLLDGHAVDVGADGALNFVLSGRLHPDAGPDGSLTGEVDLVMPDGIDSSIPDGLSDSFEVDLDARADLVLSKQTTEIDTNTDGTVVGYQITVENRGPSSARGVRVRDDLDDAPFDQANAAWSCKVVEPGEDGLSASCCDFDDSQQSCQSYVLAHMSGPVDQTVALAPGAKVSFSLDVPVADDEAAEVTNSASATAPAHIADDNMSNNSQEVTTRLLNTASLAISKEILADDSVTPGNEVQFMITVTNDGPDGVPVIVEDIFEDDLNDISWSCDATTPIPGDLIHSEDLSRGLDSALVEGRAVLGSDDGHHVYALLAGRPGDEDSERPAAIAVFKRNMVPGPDFGALALLEVEIDGVDDPDDSGLAVEGLAGARAMALSPDQRHLYVAAAGANAITVFGRKHVEGSDDFGRLVFVESRMQGSTEPADSITPVTGLDGAAGVAVSRDGRHVYVAGARDNAAAIFTRNESTGALSFEGQVKAGNVGLENALWGAGSIHVAPNDRDVYVSAPGLARFSGYRWEIAEYSSQPAYFLDGSNSIGVEWFSQIEPLEVPESDKLLLEFEHRFDFDDSTPCSDMGVVQYSLDGGRQWLSIDDPGSRFDQGGYNGDLDGTAGNPLAGTAGWCGQSAGFASGFDSVSLDLTELAEPGTMLALRFGFGRGSDSSADAGWWIGGLSVSAQDDEGQTVLLEDDVPPPGRDTGSVVHFVRQGDKTESGFGSLALADGGVYSVEGAAPTEPRADFSYMDSEAQNLYVGGRDGTIVVYGRNADSGALERVQTVTDADGLGADALRGLSALAASRDGEHVIAAGSESDSLVVFRRQPFVGILERMQVLGPDAQNSGAVPLGLSGVAGVTVSDDGQHVFSAGRDGSLGVFDRTAPDPTFDFLEAVVDGENDGTDRNVIAEGLLGARAASLSTGGKWLYVAGYGQVGSSEEGSLAVFGRDPAAELRGHHLGFEKAFIDNRNGVSGLKGANDVVSLRSGDGLYEDIYVVSDDDSAVVHFRHDLAPDGEVVFVKAYTRDTEGEDFILSGASAIAATPGGEYLFAAGRFDHGIVMFGRDADDGTLDILATAENGSGGVKDMLGPTALAVSHDSRQLYVGAFQSDAVVVLDIDAAQGGDALTWRQSVSDGSEGAVLASPSAIAISHEAVGGEHVIVTSQSGNAVTVLRRSSDNTDEEQFGKLRFQQVLTSSTDGLETLLSPRAVAVDPDNDRVYIAADGGNALIILGRNTSASGNQFGYLQPLEVRQNNTEGIMGLNRPYGLAVSTGSRRNIYLPSLGSQSVAAFARRDGSSCAGSGNGNLYEEVFIAADGTIRFTITASVDPAAEGKIDNKASLVLVENVENVGDKQDLEDTSSSLPLVPESGLVITKTASRSSVVAGERESYRIAVTNSGPSHARGVTVSDLLSANPSFDEPSAAWSCRAVGAGQLQRQTGIAFDGGAAAGLGGLSAMAWAGRIDGEVLSERLYVTGLTGNALTALSIDEATGQLTIDDVIAEGDDDVDGNAVTGLRGARNVVVSQDGRFVYVVSQVDNSVLVFEPELDDSQHENYGRLRLVQALTPHDSGLEMLDQPRGLALSNDGMRLYVAAASSSTVHAFSRNPTSGILALEHTVSADEVPGLAGATAVVVGPQDEQVYVAAAGSGAVEVFSVRADGSLEHMQTRSSPGIAGLAGATDLVLSPDGRHLYVAGRYADAVVVLPRNDDDGSQGFGRLSSPVQQLDANQLPGLTGPRALAVSSDGGSVYVAAFESDTLLALHRDRNSGELAFAARYSDTSGESGLAGISSLTFSGEHDRLFAGAVADGAVTRFDRKGFSSCSVDSGSGDVELDVDVAAGGEIIIDVSVDILADTEGVSCPEPLDPGRQCVVNSVSLEWQEKDGVQSESAQVAGILGRAARLHIDKTDHLAEFRGLAEARAVTGTGVDGNHVYVAAPGEPGIGVYELVESSGPTGTAPMTFVQQVLNGEGSVSGLNGISDVLVSPDGRHVYASSALDSSVVAFAREPGSGRLTWLARYKNNAEGFAGLSGASALAMDSQGQHLYVAGSNANAVAVLARQSDSDSADFGELTFSQMLQNGTDGVADMLRPVHLSLSPDDAHLYVAATQSDAVVVLARNGDEQDDSYGALTWQQSRRNLIGPVSGLLDVSRVLVSNDGKSLYASGSGNNALVHFARETNSDSGNFGRLEFEQALIDGNDGIEGLAGAGALTLAGDADQWLVVASGPGNTLALFERNSGNGHLQFVELLEGAGVLDGPSDLWAGAGESRLYVVAESSSALGAVDLVSSGLVLDGVMVQGGGGAVPGQNVTYEITVHNEGPSLVENARVTDVFPPQFGAVEWTCQIVDSTGPNSSCPTGTMAGNVDATVSLDAGATLVIEAVGLLRPDAEGRLINEARVELPAGMTDLGGGNNVAIDDDTVINARSDLQLEFADIPAAAVAGGVFEFSLEVYNEGPAVATGNELKLELPEALQLEDWVCLPDIEPGVLQLEHSLDDGIDSARASALSLDGRNVYVAGATGGKDALFVYERDPMTGGLNLIQQLRNLEPDGGSSSAPLIDGLAGGLDVLVSPDDAHVYVAGSADDAVAMFERDKATGTLGFIDVIRDGIGAVDGLAGARSLVADAGGQHVYVAAGNGDAVAVLARDAASGRLEFVQVRRNNQNGVEHLNAPLELVLLDDDSQLWAVAAGADAVVRFERDTDGRLQAAGHFRQGEDDGDGGQLDGLAGIRSLAAGADGAVVVVADDGSVPMLTVFDRPSAQILKLRHRFAEGDEIGTPPAAVVGLAGADRVAMDAARGVIYVTARGDAGSGRMVSAFVEDAGTAAMQYLGTENGGSGTGSPAAAALSKDGRQLYLTGGDSIDVFSILAGSSCQRAGENRLADVVDLVAGSRVTYELKARVMPNARGQFELHAGVRPLAMAGAPGQSDISTMAQVPIEPHSELQVSKSVLTDPVVAGEDASWLFTVANNGPSSIRGIEIKDLLPVLDGNDPKPYAPGVVAGSGQWQCEGLAPLVFENAMGDAEPSGSAALAISDDGLWAVAAFPANARLQLFARDASSGSLTLADELGDGDEKTNSNDEVVATVSGLAGATAAAFSRDGRNVYVVSGSGNSIARFGIDSVGGSLDYHETLVSGQGGIIGLTNPVHVVLGPNDDRVYIGARGSSAVTVFRRSLVDGGLEWSQSLRSGIGLPLNVLDGVRELVVSPGGAHLYAAAAGHDAIVTFAVNDLGDLSYVNYVANGDRHGERTVTGLGLVQSLVISPQGRHLYAASLSDHSITRFVRDPADGSLVWDGQLRAGYDIDEGLNGVNTLVLSADGQYLYAGARNDGGVTVFEREWNSGRLEAIDRLEAPTLVSVRRLIGDDVALLAAVDSGDAALANLVRQPQGFCGGADDQAVDGLVDVVDLAPGASLQYSVAAHVHPGARGMLANTAEADLPVDVVALTPDEHSSTAESPIAVVTDLDITKSIDGEASALVAGGPVRFVIDVLNDGPSHALGARIVDELPDSVINASWTCAAIPADSAGSECPVSGSGDMDELTDILAGERLLVQISATVDPAFRGQLTNTAETEAPADGSDPDPDNNRSTVSSTVNVVADIYAEKSVSAPEAAPDEVIAYTLVIGNDGPSDAPQVKVVDDPPPGMSFESWTCTASQGSCAGSGSGAIDETVSIQAGGRVEFVVQARLDAALAVGETRINQLSAVLEGEGSDPDSGNNTDSAEVVVVAAEADIQVFKSVDANSALPGDWLTYEVTVINVGPGLADRVQIIDELPESLLSGGWTCEGFDGAVCSTSVGSGDLVMETAMPAESVLVFEITAQIDPDVPAGPDEHIVNVAGAGITGDSIELDDSNNSASAITVLDLDFLFNDRFEDGQNAGGGG